MQMRQAGRRESSIQNICGCLMGANLYTLVAVGEHKFLSPGVVWVLRNANCYFYWDAGCISVDY